MARIAFVSDVAYPWIYGGVQALEHNMMKELAKKHEVYAFSFMFKGMKPSFTKDGIHHIAFRKTRAEELYVNGKRSSKLAGEFAAGIGKAMKGYAFDLVVANAYPYLHIGAVKRRCKEIGAKLVLDVAEVWDAEYWRSYLGAVKGRLAYAYMKRALKSADAYIANSTVTAKKLASIGIDKRKIRIFAPILEISRINRIRAKKPAERKRVLYVGRLTYYKRVDLLIEAAEKAAIIEPELKVLIAGEGPEENRLKAMISEKGLDRIVKIVPHIKGDERLYRTIIESKALVNMSEREGLSAIAIESLALGTPVLLPSDTPIPEEVRRMCVVRDIEEMPKAMAQIADAVDKGSFIRHGEGLKQFYVSNVNAFYSKLIEDVCGNADPG